MKTFLFACLLTAAAPLMAQQAAQPIQFDGCRDRQGQPVATVTDDTLRAVARLGVIEGKTVIRHNPAMLPRLLPESRMFVFAHECGLQFLGFAPGAELSVAQVRQADCWAVGVLRNSRILGDAAAVQIVEDDLTMTPDDWSLLPGPRRELRLAACPSAAATRGGLRIDTTAPPSERWNACQQTCASKLFACGRGASCQAAFEQCSAGCK